MSNNCTSCCIGARLRRPCANQGPRRHMRCAVQLIMTTIFVDIVALQLGQEPNCADCVGTLTRMRRPAGHVGSWIEN